MRTEPDLDRGTLLSALSARYALDVATLEFIPKGIDSWAYLAVATDGCRHFVRLTRPAPAEARTPAAAELPLLAALADLGRVRVARPVADRDGGLVHQLGEYELVVLTYLDGRTLEAETAWPAPLYGSVADALAAIHASTDAVRHLVQRTETFDLPFLPSLVDAFATLAFRAQGPTSGPPQRDLADLLLPHQARLRATIERLETLRDVARARAHADARSVVLCHTDLWGSNLLLGDDGDLAVLDWNSARLGPVEADLFMFAGTRFFPPERFAWFLDRYEAASHRRPVRPEADVLAFYLYRRNLEDLADFVDALMHDRTEAMDRDATIRIVTTLIAEWPALDARVVTIRETLRTRA